MSHAFYVILKKEKAGNKHFQYVPVVSWPLKLAFIAFLMACAGTSRFK